MNFLENLTQKLNNSTINFDEFKEALWIHLCSLNNDERMKLSKEFNIIGKYMSDTNIANINQEIIEQLGISFMQE
jgi:hypothetical protein